MNLDHLKYALETARAGSITKAAQNLFIAQPNLSNALKELEATVGFMIFKRSHQGVEVTRDGKEFLDYAKSIVNQVENLELRYKSQGKNLTRLRIGSVRSSNVSQIIAEFINEIPKTSAMKIDFRETTQFEILRLIELNELDIGMIGFLAQHKSYFNYLLNSKNIQAEPIRELPLYLLMSTHHPLAKEENIDISMLGNYTEVIHGDLDTPITQFAKFKAEAGIDNPHRVVHIYDRGTLMDILSNCHDCYKWTNSTHAKMFKAYDLVGKKCENNVVICEMVVYSKNRALTKEQKMVISRLKNMANNKEFE